MITYLEAVTIARKYIETFNSKILGGTPVLLESETMEVSFGWIFFYQSKEFLDTGNYSYMLAGNAPFIIDRNNARLTVTGTAHQLEYYLDEYSRNFYPPDAASLK